MKKLTSTEIRNLWFEFFKSKNHVVMESSSLIPMDDDSLLFVNAGVTPLKKYFDGSIVPDNKRIATVQKCIRTNDIENVGVTKVHHTFFEMMGNFSIGDYFKDEALEFSFEFLTSPEWCDIPKEKIYATVYTADEVAYDKWLSLGLPESQIARLDGNYWEIGEGPSGPDSEIFYDRGVEYDKDGDALAKFRRDEDQARYVEIWNNVFSQYNAKNGIDRKYYKELPNKNIDTGAGLERWCCVFQGVDSNFDTDLFVPIIKRIEDCTGKSYDGSLPFKVIADHVRACTMALSDGAIFENSGRGYVLRRLLRRSVRMGKKLGVNEPFLYKIVGGVVEVMGESYPDLVENKAVIKTLIYDEEEMFHRTLVAGERRLQELIETSHDKTVSGYDAFKLYDTYGFPFELTLEYLEDVGMTTSREEFDQYMKEAKKLAQANRKQEDSMNVQNEQLLNFKENSEFTYDEVSITSKVIALMKDEEFVDELTDNGYVILDKTCFYAESGGQVADTGAFKNDNFKAKVTNVLKAPNEQHLHLVEIVEGAIKVGDNCTIKIVEEKRNRTANNHTTIHIIQKVLQDLFSNNIHQAGSYVDDTRLRFDFTYTGKISDDSIIEIEKRVNEKISDSIDCSIKYMSLEEAKNIGAMALFTDKYKDTVRVVTIGDSIELCGGTHIKNTSEIERVAILNVESKGSNLYRIEATTNENIPVLISNIVANYMDEIKKLLVKAANILENAKNEGIELEFLVDVDTHGLSSYGDIVYSKNYLEYIQNEVRDLEKKYNASKMNNIVSDLSEYMDNVEEINGQQAIIMKTAGKDLVILKEIIDTLAQRLGKCLIFIANVNGENVNYLCKSSLSASAGLIIKRAAQMSLGNGGGSDTFAQGGGKSIDQLDEILEMVKEEVM